MFPGPPDYEDMQKGDMPEPEYILRLHDPICIFGNAYADQNSPFQDVQQNADEGMNRWLTGIMTTNACLPQSPLSHPHRHSP
ncbi:hypothetical protein Gain_0191_011 [Komagataeibacter intermedius TF2]|uniref:Uncharacterized protein n=2 Tax=Komagataeibacter intermedius TaxID=66229 RepID=A0A0N1F6X9_9PROT|nr:hypothetical protein GLUCOINTEAF2_0201214 [Komagataeibacter intermedius AF2]GAN88378.1 hypothetical protein Gain_0191_011 [Komagataeibacter intermedius TF2]GBQ67460.1 hypothetical protein AA0521_0994 [Komagataeibacter intermedius NRIC 0521]